MKKMNTLSAKTFHILSLSLIFLLLGIGTIQATTYTWAGGTGNWNDPAKWNCGGCGTIPGATDDIIITTGTVTMNVNATVNDFTFSGATIEGSNTLTVDGTLDISGSNVALKGTATLTLNGTTNHTAGRLNIEDSASLSNAFGATYTLSGTGFWGFRINLATFFNSGTINVNRDGIIIEQQFTPSTFTNEVGGVFNVTGGASIHTVKSIFTNNGTINYNSGSKLDFNSFFNNNGNITLHVAGSLEMRGGTIASSSSWSGGTGLTLTGINSTITTIEKRLPSTWTFDILGGTNNLNAIIII